MRFRSFSLFALIFAISCSGQPATVPTMGHRAVAAEEYITIGAQAVLGDVGDSIHVTAVSTRSDGTRTTYDFPSDVGLYRHHTRTSGDLVEFHGKSGATFLELSNIRTLERRSRYGTSSTINPTSLPVRSISSTRNPQCTLIPWSARGGKVQVAGCGGGTDPGLCTDCSGPLAPGGDISCHYTSSCGGDPTLGTGRGTGIFRLLNPQISCYFSFVDESYSCYTDGISNTDSPAPHDYSLGYEYNFTLGAAVLHCAGPTENTEAFVGGKTPDLAINLGFARVSAGSAKAWVMHTAYTSNTAITAVYFAFRFPSPFNGVCTGSN